MLPVSAGLMRLKDWGQVRSRPLRKETAVLGSCQSEMTICRPPTTDLSLPSPNRGQCWKIRRLTRCINCMNLRLKLMSAGLCDFQAELENGSSFEHSLPVIESSTTSKRY